MYKDKWITLEEAENLHNISKGTIYYIYTQTKPNWIVRSKLDSTYYINIGYLFYVYDKRQRIIQETQNLYIEAEEKFGRSFIVKKFKERTKMKGPSVTYIITRLFSYIEYSYTDTKISEGLLQFNWFLTELLTPITFDSQAEQTDYYMLKNYIKDFNVS